MKILIPVHYNRRNTNLSSSSENEVAQASSPLNPNALSPSSLKDVLEHGVFWQDVNLDTEVDIITSDVNNSVGKDNLDQSHKEGTSKSHCIFVEENSFDERKEENDLKKDTKTKPEIGMKPKSFTPTRNISSSKRGSPYCFVS